MCVRSAEKPCLAGPHAWWSTAPLERLPPDRPKERGRPSPSVLSPFMDPSGTPHPAPMLHSPSGLAGS